MTHPNSLVNINLELYYYSWLDYLQLLEPFYDNIGDIFI